MALEQSLGSKSKRVLDLGVGAIGRDLLRTADLVNPNPDSHFFIVEFIDNTATLIIAFHALVKQLFSGGCRTDCKRWRRIRFRIQPDIASTDAFRQTSLNTPIFVASPNDRPWEFWILTSGIPLLRV